MACSRKQFCLTHFCCPYWSGCGAEIFTFKLLEVYCSSWVNEIWQKWGECLRGQAAIFGLVSAAGNATYYFQCTPWYSASLDSNHEASLSAEPEYLEICIIIWSCWLPCAAYFTARICIALAFLMISQPNDFFSPSESFWKCKLLETSLKRISLILYSPAFLVPSSNFPCKALGLISPLVNSLV